MLFRIFFALGAVSCGSKPNDQTKVLAHAGNVIKTVNVHPIFWTGDVTHQNELNQYYSDLVQFLPVLSQYGGIDKGSVAQGMQINQPTKDVSETDIVNQLTDLMNQGQIAHPTGNYKEVYAIHLPPNITISSANGKKFCQDFCGFHNFFKHSGWGDSYYSVIPDNSVCPKCGGLDGLLKTTSHELFECVTDPDQTGYFSGNDPGSGEISDVCNDVTHFDGASGKNWARSGIWSETSKSCM